MNAFSNSGTRSDGMMAVLSNLAGDRQRMQAINNNPFYNPDVIYATEGLAQSIIDKPAEDCMSAGFDIEADKTEDILNEFDRLDAIPVITDCFRWTRLHGGAAILVFVNDGLALTEPMDINRINQIDDLIDYSASCLSPLTVRYTDPTKKNYGHPSLYEVRPKFGNPFIVHESRFIFISGDPVPHSLINNQMLPWIGRSALDSCYREICRYNDCLRLAKDILERKAQLIHKMSDLGTMLASGEDTIVAKRIAIADAVRGNTNMLSIDALDDMVLADTNLGGISDVISDSKIALCASSRMPQAILFGESASGLNATVDGENNIYQTLLNGIRNRRLKPVIERLAGLIWAQKAIPRSEPAAWQVKLHALSSPRPMEVADVELKKAQAQKTKTEALVLVVENQLLLPEEVRIGIADTFPELNISGAIPSFEMPEDATLGN